uniref:Uncharacterized protein n=1 Tax=Romanomermis culicivorax TaxID=13658 RepID=A0A915KNY7_ROMCU
MTVGHSSDLHSDPSDHSTVSWSEMLNGSEEDSYGHQLFSKRPRLVDRFISHFQVTFHFSSTFVGIGFASFLAFKSVLQLETEKYCTRAWTIASVAFFGSSEDLAASAAKIPSLLKADRVTQE